MDADGCSWALGVREGGDRERRYGETGDSGYGAIPGEWEDPEEVDKGGVESLETRH
jgi:hypothetical protein